MREINRNIVREKGIYYEGDSWLKKDAWKMLADLSQRRAIVLAPLTSKNTKAGNGPRSVHVDIEYGLFFFNGKSKILYSLRDKMLVNLPC